jgi:hypothetical protein
MMGDNMTSIPTAPAALPSAVTPTTESTASNHDTLDHILLQTVHEHPFSVSGGTLIIGVTLLKIIKKLRGDK